MRLSINIHRCGGVLAALFEKMCMFLFSFGLLFLFSAGVYAEDCDQATMPSVWKKTIERVSTGIVTLRLDIPIAFDTENNRSTQATGFVIDKKQGLILTNRHVVTPGPVSAQAIFINKEELDLRPVYRDPVHDFGVFAYDPKKLAYLDPHEFQLHPAGAQVGCDIRVIGNDAGEQISILAGTLSRIDRAAPNYGAWRYNDFNTFYIQAASGTSGGSSGSPVITVDGKAVALNAGASSRAASSYYLPLQRVAYAVEKIRRGQRVPRGTLQATLTLKPFAELKRLGLPAIFEERERSQGKNHQGLLVVDRLLPKSPASESVKVGDILVSVNGKPMRNFVSLEHELDTHVAQTVDLKLVRRGQVVSAQVFVSDLHSLTPKSYFTLDRSVLNTLSYQLARHFNRPVSGVYVSAANGLLKRAKIPKRALILSVNHHKTPTVEAFVAQLEQRTEGEPLRIRYLDTQSKMIGLAQAPYRNIWFPSRYCVLNEETGQWPCEVKDRRQSLSNLSEQEAERQRKSALKTPHQMSDITDYFPELNQATSVVQQASSSLVQVVFDMPFPVGGISDWYKSRIGSGVVVDAQKGWVVVDRATVPSLVGNVRLTFFNAKEVEGRILYIHPLHNLAVVSYPPEALVGMPVKAVKFRTKASDVRSEVTVLGINSANKIKFRHTKISDLGPLPLSLPSTPSFRDHNIEVMNVLAAVENANGIVFDKKGKLVALWARFDSKTTGKGFYRGIPVKLLRDMLAQVENKTPIYTMDSEFSLLSMVDVRRRGLSEKLIDAFIQSKPSDRKLLAVKRIAAGSAAEGVLKNGDVILKVDGQWVSSFHDMERVSQKPSMTLNVFRNDEVMDVELSTTPLPGYDVDKALYWSGTYLQVPHRAAALQRGIAPEGVWVAYYLFGSPASRYGLKPTSRIVKVEGNPVNSLEDFIALVKNVAHQDALRLTLLDRDDRVKVMTLRVDREHWPMREFFYRHQQWQWRDWY